MEVRYRKAKHSWLMQHYGLNQTNLIEATFLHEAWIPELFLHTVHIGYQVLIQTNILFYELDKLFISSESYIKEFLGVLESFLQLNVWLWFIVFTCNCPHREAMATQPQQSMKMQGQDIKDFVKIIPVRSMK